MDLEYLYNLYVSGYIIYRISTFWPNDLWGDSGGTTCVWAPVREKHLGPHKMMTYVGRSGGILRQKIFEFRVSEMAFPAF